MLRRDLRIRYILFNKVIRNDLNVLKILNETRKESFIIQTIFVLQKSLLLKGQNLYYFTFLPVTLEFYKSVYFKICSLISKSFLQIVVDLTFYSIFYRNFFKIQWQITPFIILFTVTGTKKINTAFIKKKKCFSKKCCFCFVSVIFLLFEFFSHFKIKKIYQLFMSFLLWKIKKLRLSKMVQ